MQALSLSGPVGEVQELEIWSSSSKDLIPPDFAIQPIPKQELTQGLGPPDTPKNPEVEGIFFPRSFCTSLFVKSPRPLLFPEIPLKFPYFPLSFP